MGLFAMAPTPREFYSTRHTDGFLYVIKAVDKKEVPKQLSSKYTSHLEAKKAIDSYKKEFEISEEQRAKYHKRQELTAKREELNNAKSA